MGTLTECVVPAGDVSGYVAKAVRLGKDVRLHEGVIRRLEERREAFFDDMVIGTRGRCVVYVCVCCMWYGYRYEGGGVYGIWGAECLYYVLCVV